MHAVKGPDESGDWCVPRFVEVDCRVLGHLAVRRVVWGDVGIPTSVPSWPVRIADVAVAGLLGNPVGMRTRGHRYSPIGGSLPWGHLWGEIQLGQATVAIR